MKTKKISKNFAQQETTETYTASCGVCVRIGRRQSMPSSNIASCAGVSDTVPFVACGQINRPRSNRFAKRQSPSPSNHRTLIKSPRLPRKMYTCPENGFSCSAVCTIPLSPTKPRRISVTPATIQIRVPAGSPIISPNFPAPHATLPRPQTLQCVAFLSEIRFPWCPAIRLGLHSLVRRVALPPPSRAEVAGSC